MKKHIPQFELPGAEDIFNLAGQTATSSKPTCGKKLFGFMPPCALEAGHAGDCSDGFGGFYHHDNDNQTMQIPGL